MSVRYHLRGLGNSELLAGLSALARQSNELTAQLLAHLVELEERMLHLELGFPSLFSYCVEVLGMSEGAAGRRVAAARVCRRIPGVFERVARGQVHLCALCALAPHLSADNATELLDACRGKTPTTGRGVARGAVSASGCTGADSSAAGANGGGGGCGTDSAGETDARDVVCAAGGE